MKTLHELFEDGMKDIYNAEKQLIKALPKMAKMAKNPKLRQGFENHLRETEAHAQRIEMACRTLGMKPTGMVCKGMKGLIDEASEHMGELKPGACADAELIALAQKVEHYEIGTYGTLCTWARLMGHTEALDLLKSNLNDEERTDQLLTQVAESEVNQLAARESNEVNMRGNGKMRGTRGRTASTTKRKSTGTGTRSGRTTSGGTSTARRASAGRSPSRRSATGRTTTPRSSGRSTSSRTTAGHSKTSETGRSRSTGTSGRGRTTAR